MTHRALSRRLFVTVALIAALVTILITGNAADGELIIDAGKKFAITG